ncbi:hypothetical protein CONLIGDRAFT_641183 [Coniochaeta ligniaria NRRL 30616]|uniref:FeS cluster biogenesis domain-containing protein n=1 Tax=Coniochaeta ligniaria NRRL 30616 TaxID=1408157 RepID=A0A1J7J226_9PEZI|nr:hypothetical protein CONLIGDRAFT_641183 [Coniochaeta ligniaria NRRL 30616]
MASLRCPNASSSAKLFVQLSLRHQYLARPAQLFDLLVPAASAHYHTEAVRRQQNHSYSGVLLPPPSLTHIPSPRRRFSTSPSHRRTQALYNPQQDEDGKEMMLEITPRAAKRLAEIMAKDDNPYLALRIQVESGGCHGFQYLMSLVTLPPTLPDKTTAQAADDGAVIREDDTIFTFAPEHGGEAANNPTLEAPKIILDAPSLELLKGSKVDFTMELIGSQFKIVDNPLATSSCGCGTSFDIKI